MRYAFLFAVAFASAAAFAQHAPITDHRLGEVPVLPAKVSTMPENIVVLRRSAVQEITEEQGVMVEYDLMHLTVFLRDDGAIERENKAYVDLDGVEEVVRREARSIAPDGKVIALDDDDFKKATDESGDGSYLYFAFEGLVPGSMVDYYYVLKKSPNLQGDGFTLQLGVPILQEDVQVLHPQRLVFRTKSYQGAPEAVVDSSITDVEILRWTINDIPALEEERNANMGAARMRISFKLDRVPDRGMKDVSGYIGATKIYHTALNLPIEGKAAKDLKALIGRMKLGDAPNDLEKVRRAEDHLKNNFQVLNTNSPELNDLGTILRAKTCSQFGMVNLTCAVLRSIGIDHQVVITSDRTRVPFDKDFESYQFLDEVVLFIPSIDRYLDPVTTGLRVGFLKSENMANYGLFIRNYDVGGGSTGVGSVKYIEPLPDTASVHDHFITARISGDGDAADIDFETHMTGYFASIQCFYPLLNEEKKVQLRDQLVEYFVENAESKELQVENAESDLFGVKPFIIKGQVHTRKFNASAGEKVLFKVGELIGPQMEMYSEKPRKLPVDDDFNRRFDRTIDVVIPDGWTVQNLSELTLERHLDLDGKRQLAFESSATLEGNTVKVRVSEYYRLVEIPLEHFEAYRGVVNAAADFNKLALILVRKG